MFEAELFAGGGEGVRGIARPVIGHDPFDGDAEASVIGEGGFQVGDGALCFLIGEHACMDAGGRAASGTSRRGIQEGGPRWSKESRFCRTARSIIVPVYCHSRLRGNGLSKPLDSGLRRAATGILGGLFQTPLYRLRPVGVPSRRIQDFLSINDGEGNRHSLIILLTTVTKKRDS